MAAFPNLIEVSEPEAFFILMHGEASAYPLLTVLYKTPLLTLSKSH